MIHNPPSMKGMDYIRDKMGAVRPEKGATHTEKYGDMRSYKRAANANARATNTRLTNFDLTRKYSGTDGPNTESEFEKNSREFLEYWSDVKTEDPQYHLRMANKLPPHPDSIVMKKFTEANGKEGKAAAAKVRKSNF